MIQKRYEFIKTPLPSTNTAIRKLKALPAAAHLLSLLYKSIVRPILLYCLSHVFIMPTASRKNKLTRITHHASKIIGLPTSNLSDLKPSRTEHAI